MAQSLRASLLTEISGLFGDVNKPKGVGRPCEISCSLPVKVSKVKNEPLKISREKREPAIAPKEKSELQVKQNSEKPMKRMQVIQNNGQPYVQRIKGKRTLKSNTFIKKSFEFPFDDDFDIARNNQTKTFSNTSENAKRHTIPSKSIPDSFESPLRKFSDLDYTEKPQSSTMYSDVDYDKKSKDSQGDNLINLVSSSFESRFENDSDFETNDDNIYFEASNKDDTELKCNKQDPGILTEVETIEPKDPLEGLSEEVMITGLPQELMMTNVNDILIKSELLDTKEGLIKEENLYDSYYGDCNDNEEEFYYKPKCEVVLLDENFAASLLHSGNQTQSESQKKDTRKRICYICKARFKSAQMLQRHIKNEHEVLDIKFETERASVKKCHRTRKKASARNKNRNKIPQKCSICSITLIGESRLKYHLVRIHKVELKEFTLKCRYCNLEFDNKNTLDVHIRRKHISNQRNAEKEGLVCEYCRMVFEHKTQLAVHKSTHREGDEEIHSGNVHCGICNAIFNDMNQVRIHMNRKHNCFKSEFKFKCDECDLSYDKENSLRYHQIRVHVKEKSTKKSVKDDSNKILACNDCSSTFVTKINLLKHMAIVHNKSNSENQFFYCEICHEICSSAMTLKRHKRSKHSEVTDYKCVECGHVLNNKDSYRAHFRRVHLKKRNDMTEQYSGKEQLMCEICSCTFKGPTRIIVLKKLQKHMQSHVTQKVDKSVFCQYCGEIYLESQVKKHMRSEHKDLFLTHKCVLCPYKTHSGQLLNVHIRKKHEKEQKIYTCEREDCDYSCTERSQMNVHITRKHTIRPRLQCNECDFSTLNKYYLRDHMKEHETGEKSYKCTKCPYATNSSNSMTQHSYVHLTEKKYECDQCDYKAKYNTQLYVHKIKHKSDDEVRMYKCPECPFETRYRNSFTSHSEKHGEEKYHCGRCSFKTRFSKQYQTHLKRHILIDELENESENECDD